MDPQQVIGIKPTLKILGVTLDNKLSFKDHVTITLKKAYAKIAALRRIKRLIPSSIMISLYKTYVLPHLEYCFPLLLGISTPLKNKLEKCKFYTLRTVLVEFQGRFRIKIRGKGLGDIFAFFSSYIHIFNLYIYLYTHLYFICRAFSTWAIRLGGLGNHPLRYRRKINCIVVYR